MGLGLVGSGGEQSAFRGDSGTGGAMGYVGLP